MASALWMLGKWCSWQNGGIQCQNNEHAKLVALTLTGIWYLRCFCSGSGYQSRRDCHPFIKECAVISEFPRQDGKEEEDGKTLVWDKLDRAITCVFCRDLHLTPIFSGPLKKRSDLFKIPWSLAKSCFKRNYCHACHARFAVFFPVPSCCVSSLLSGKRGSEMSTIERRVTSVYHGSKNICIITTGS